MHAGCRSWKRQFHTLVAKRLISASMSQKLHELEAFLFSTHTSCVRVAYPRCSAWPAEHGGLLQGFRRQFGKRAYLHTHMLFSHDDAHTVVNTRSLRLPRMWQETHLCGALKVAK